MVYLGSMTTEDGKSEVEVKRRIELAKNAFNNMKSVLSSRNIILFKIRLLRWYNFKRFECCDPKNRRCKHSLDIKGNIKGHMWFVSMGAVIENLINLNISTSYFLVTHIVVLLNL